MISRKLRLAPAACLSTREMPRATNAIANSAPMAAYNVKAPTNSSAGMSGLFSVDRNRRSGDLAGGSRRKEYRQIRYVLRRHPPRRVGRGFGLAVCIGVHGSRQNGV